jgi:hypothetical protein
MTRGDSVQWSNMLAASVAYWSQFLATDPEVRVDSRRYQIFWVVGLERGPLSLVSTTEELRGRKSHGSGLQSREYGLGIRHADHVAPSIRKTLALTALTSGSLSVGIVRSRTHGMEFSYKQHAVQRWEIVAVLKIP